MTIENDDRSPQDLAEEGSFFRGLTFRMSFGLVLFLLSVLSVNYFVAESRGREVIIQQSDKLNDEIGKTITLSLREKLSASESLTRSLAKLASVLEKSPDVFLKVVPEILNQSGMENMIAGGGIWPEPYMFNPEKERSAFFCHRLDFMQVSKNLSIGDVPIK